jgi:hypothetical protein
MILVGSAVSTTTLAGIDLVSLPTDVVTLKLTSYDPSAVYVWLGDSSVLVPPSPKSQSQAVIGALPGSEVSVNSTSSGGGPLKGVRAKLAVGETVWVVTITFAGVVFVLLPTDVVTLKLTSYVPSAVYV